MENFIYVFDKKSRDVLLADGFHLLKSDEKNDVYVFVNQEQFTFKYSEMKYCLSNILSF
jgi:hypothetical protein